MKIKRIAHLGIAVKDLDSAVKFFTQGLPLEITHTEDFQGMKIGFLPVGDSSYRTIARHVRVFCHKQVFGKERRRHSSYSVRG